MNEDFVTISIRCQQCLTWSLDDANFCHRCGVDLGPWPEVPLFATMGLIAESKSIIDWLVENEHERLCCSHCFRWRDRRKMKQTRSGKFLCFDHVDCRNTHEEWLIQKMLEEKGCSIANAKKWIETPLQVFDSLTPRQMIQDDREEEVKVLLVEMESGFTF